MLQPSVSNEHSPSNVVLDGKAQGLWARLKAAGARSARPGRSTSFHHEGHSEAKTFAS
jgi:hypothetical protein